MLKRALGKELKLLAGLQSRVKLWVVMFNKQGFKEGKNVVVRRFGYV